MSVKLTWSGLKEFQAEFGKLPETLNAEAAPIIQAHARAAAATVQAAYPIRTTGLHPTKHRRKPWYPPGSLKQRVFVTRLTNVPNNLGWVVKSADPIAWIYENGTETRQYLTVNGKQKIVGKITGTHIFVKTMIPERRQMYQELKELIVRNGIVVTGEL